MDIDRRSKAEVAAPQEKIGSFDLLPFPFYHLMGTPARVITLFQFQCTLLKSSPNHYQIKQGIDSQCNGKLVRLQDFSVKEQMKCAMVLL